MSHTIDIIARDTALLESALPLLGWRNDIAIEEGEAEFP